MKYLIAGAWLGEFGHEIYSWVPYIRYLVWKNEYKKVIVICRSGHEYLYEDFADFFFNDDTEGQISEWLINGKNPEISEEIKGSIIKFINKPLSDCEVVSPSKDIRDGKKFHLMYGNENKRLKTYDVLIHARATENFKTGYRNWSEKKWIELINKNVNYRYASVGSKKGSLHIPNTDDLRGIDLKKLCSHMKTAKVLLSPSSGTAHLACFCGLPHIVWTDNKKHGVIGGYTNKDRYKHLWNPFNTRAVVIDESWNPEVSVVNDRLNDMLKTSYVVSEPIKRREIKKQPTICMITYNRKDIFKNTIENLEKSNISTKNLFIFDDNSNDPYKLQYISNLRSRYRVLNQNQRLGVYLNSIIGIDIAFQFSSDKHIVYCQDDLAFSKDWYYNAMQTVEKMNRDGVDWGILALLHFRGETKDPYYIMKTGHPGGACWIINKKMWYQYRKSNIIYNIELAGTKLFDHRMCHWMHHNNGQEWAVAYTGKSLVQHVGKYSTLHNKNMSKYKGLDFIDGS